MPVDVAGLIEEVETFQNLLIGVATNGEMDNSGYRELRQSLMGNSVVSDLLPSFVRTNSSAAQFRSFTQGVSDSWRGRREHIWGEFRPLLDRLESQNQTPPSDAISEALRDFDSNTVQRDWTKALDRLPQDPEGAITSARSLLESVCKHILDKQGIAYKDDIDLPSLYKVVSTSLNLAPEQHSEQIFKQILGGCASIANGLAGLRNKLGDAHGQGSNQVKPARRHAELAVNVAGAMALFLVETWSANHS